MQINVAVTDANNIVCTIVPPQVQTITIDRGVAGNGIVSIVPVTISTFQYLRITYTNGTVSDVGPLTSTAYTATAPINITGNTISLLTVPIATGGTGATTAAAAIQNLLPSYTANGNKRLGLNAGATALEWVADGGGTVTSVAFSGGSTGLTSSGGPITSSGTITLAGTLAIANGGSGQTTAQAAMDSFAGAVTSGFYLRGNGTNVLMSGIQVADVPTLNQNTTGTAANITATSNSTLITLSSLSLPGSQVSGNISGNAANVTGIVAIANGGTGQTTANTALNALLPAQTGNASKYLQTDGTNASWDAISLSTADITGILPTANGGTGLSAFTANGVFYASTTSAIAQSANLTFNGTDFQSASNSYLATSSGNVGVGTSTPSFKLDVDGIMRVKGYFSASAGYILLGTNASETIYGGGSGGASNVISFSTNNQGALSLEGNGNINVLRTGARITGDFSNATVANRVLFQSSTTNGNTLVGAIPNGTGVRSDIILYNSPDSANASFLDIFSSDTQYAFSGNKAGTGSYLPMTFYTGGSERVRIDTSGNVGVGVTPSAWASGNRFIDVNASASYGAFGSSDSMMLANAYWNGSNWIRKNANNAWRMTMESSSGAPSWTFQYAGNSTAGSTISWSEAMRLDSSGNVGIGMTPSGDSRFEVYGADAATIYKNVNTGTGSSDGFYVGMAKSSGTDGYVYNRESANVIFGTANAERARIDSSGNVGIGTSSPLERLHVAGGPALVTGTLSSLRASSTSIDFSGGAGRIIATGSDASTVAPVIFGNATTTTYTERMRINSSGNVGIGTSTPSGRLDVANTLTPYLNITALGAGSAAVLCLNATSPSSEAITYQQALRFGSATGANAAGFTEQLRLNTSGSLSSAGGQYYTRYYQTNTFTPNNNWIRLCTFISTNQGQAVDFIFAIPGHHIMFRVKFSKTTSGGLGGGGVLDVELLGAYPYPNYTPFDWRLTDQGTNSDSHIDIRFPTNTGETIGSRINVISSYAADVPTHATFPMTNLGSGNNGASYSNMGNAGGFTKQWFRMITNKYVFYDNNMTITSGATPPTA